MDGKMLFQKCCKEVGIDFDSTFFFAESQVALHKGKRITQNYNPKSIGEKDYIVRYYPDNDIYFVWLHIRGRNSCSFNVPNDYAVTSGIIRVDEKRIGKGKNTEPVFSFRSRDIAKFLKEQVIPVDSQ